MYMYIWLSSLHHYVVHSFTYICIIVCYTRTRNTGIIWCNQHLCRFIVWKDFCPVLICPRVPTPIVSRERNCAEIQAPGMVVAMARQPNTIIWTPLQCQHSCQSCRLWVLPQRRITGMVMSMRRYRRRTMVRLIMACHMMVALRRILGGLTTICPFHQRWIR